jgi:hypothetical protein
MTETTYNGWKNWETWNLTFWILENKFLYETARACVLYCGENETPWDKFVRCMMEGEIGHYLGKTGDGVSWNDPKVSTQEMNTFLYDLNCV